MLRASEGYEVQTPTWWKVLELGVWELFGFQVLSIVPCACARFFAIVAGTLDTIQPV